ncbi:MAG: hypothetical protein LLF90_06185 [Methanomicrobiaceae archaeon]|uniref:hypothetical protein n=1 Tax=Methanoculleus sp. TaxID=90427 RepID=UPI0032113F7D|nr:hypothetical protein [Methanomicrobiaceae archaeon]
MTVAPYVPEPLLPAGIDWEAHTPQIASANRALADTTASSRLSRTRDPAHPYLPRKPNNAAVCHDIRGFHAVSPSNRQEESSRLA